MRYRRQWIMALGLALVLFLVNREIAAKRDVIADGRPLYLELRPVDPRSIIQGDYMALGFAEDASPDSSIVKNMPFRGTVILAIDELGVGRFKRLDDGGELSAGEIRVRYRRYKEWSTDRIAYTARSYFFQEGMADHYANAKFALLHVDNAGASVLVNLADENRRPIAVSGPDATP